MERSVLAMTRPLFILSVPRSGSTLTQRLLGAHPEIATTGEPWLLLPQLQALRPYGAYTQYGHAGAIRGIRSFWEQLPAGESDYLKELRGFATRLYTKAAAGADYFVDKSPRYSLFVDDLLRVFPDGKAIFLWRNPLAVLASMLTTWGDAAKWNLYAMDPDLFRGLPNLVETYERHRDTTCSVRYEDLVADPTTELKRIFDYLDLSFVPGVIDHFSTVDLPGYRDPTGVERYQHISAEPLAKWQRVLMNPLRKRWCRGYIRWIGEHRLNVMGYNQDELISDLERVPSSFEYLVSDVLRMAYGHLWTTLEHNVLGKNGVRTWALDRWAANRGEAFRQADQRGG
jgi:hypothetical protein